MTPDHNAKDGDEGAGAHVVPGILAMADCAEADSELQRLVVAASEQLAVLGVDVTILDLGDLDLPEFAAGDLYSPPPQGVLSLRQLLCAHDGFVIGLPSLQDELRPMLMNAIAWSLSPTFGGQAVGAYTGKCASLMSIQPDDAECADPFGSARAMLSSLGVTVLPDDLLLSAGSEDIQRRPMKDRAAQAGLEHQMGRLVGTIRWVRGMSHP